VSVDSGGNWSTISLSMVFGPLVLKGVSDGRQRRRWKLPWWQWRRRRGWQWRSQDGRGEAQFRRQGWQEVIPLYGGGEAELQPRLPLIYFMLPKTQFHYSPIYYEHLVLPKNFVRPTDEFIFKNTRKLELKWRKIEKKILKELEFVTGLKWQESHIYIYTISGVGWFSAPLTMSITEDTDVILDMLIHELIHRILSENENWKIIKKRWFKLTGEYKKENLNARIHVPIHAIHKHIFLKLFNQKKLELEIKRVKNDKDYARAWEIVQSGDYKKIIQSLNPKFRT